MKVEDLYYDLPDSAIAQSAVEPRDSARLLDTRGMVDWEFRDLPRLLEPGDLVVVNETRVRRARLRGHKKDSGGAVELLVLEALETGGWTAMVRPARRVRIGTTLIIAGVEVRVVKGPEAGVVTVEFDTSDAEALIARQGEVPLPPYFHGDLGDDRRYQTMFAREPGSAAAPTAGLHFTQRVVAGLRDRGVVMANVDLHVGLDTFRPIAVENIDEHVMHSEWCSVGIETADAITSTRERGGRVVAVGTTTTRTLETFAVGDGTVRSGSTETNIFLKPGSGFTVVDLMVTNFHVPGSTLIAMIAGFMGARWLDAYHHALRSGYRFLSFGDAMICERADR